MSEENSEPLPVLVNKASVTRKLVPKKAEKTENGRTEEKKKSVRLFATKSAPSSVLRRQEILGRANLSMNASCSSDASTDSYCSRASTGRIVGRGGGGGGYRRIVAKKKQEKIVVVSKIPDVVAVVPTVAVSLEGWKKRCAWVTPNTDPCYTTFHDEEWGVPVHEDWKLFELLVLSGALAELTWPTILSKRHIFREAFMDFDPALVSKLNEKKILAAGSTASSLLSEPKLRAIIDNARQILKIVEEFGSFDKYCWGFVNHKPITSRFRYPRQVPVKTPKADVISKDLVKRGFRSVGQTVIYSFMQAAGMTNDHLINCYRFEECVAAACGGGAILDGANEEKEVKVVINHKVEEGKMLVGDIGLELSRAVDGLSILSS